MINVTVRKRESAKEDRKILYLDFYPAIIVNGKSTRREYLGLFIYEKWKEVIKDGKKVTAIVTARDLFDKEHNVETMKAAEMKRMQRFNELNKPEVYTPFEREQLRLIEIGEGSFTEYLKKYVIRHQRYQHDSFVSLEKHVNHFAGGELKFSDITERFCNGFKEYLITARNISSNKNNSVISQNTASLYFTKFKSILNEAYKAGHLPTHLNDKIGSIKTDETRRNYLTIDELNNLVKTPCTIPVLKSAALFSALTGLRISDILKLTWDEVVDTDGNCVLNFTQLKTGGIETLPISQQAVDLMGDREHGRPFDGLVYDAHKGVVLKNWITAAGITKKITFHCFRHTFATLQLSAGTDIYTVSKMLGHRDLKTTQIYAKVVNQAKRDAVNRITLQF